MVLVVVSLALVVCMQLVDSMPKSGPYDTRIYRLEKCEDPGTAEIDFGTKVDNKGNNVYTYTNNVTWKYDWDDKVRADVDLQVLKDGVYRPRFISQSFKTCDAFMKVAKEVLTSFYAAAGYEFKDCPVPADVFVVKDWVIQCPLNNMPTMMYGKYRLVLVFSRLGKRIGCVILYGEVMPKS